MSYGVSPDVPACGSEFAQFFPRHDLALLFWRKRRAVEFVQHAGIDEEIALESVTCQRLEYFITHRFNGVIEVDHDGKRWERGCTRPPGGEVVVVDGSETHLGDDAHEPLEVLLREGFLAAGGDAVTHGDGNSHLASVHLQSAGEAERSSEWTP